MRIILRVTVCSKETSQEKGRLCKRSSRTFEREVDVDCLPPLGCQVSISESGSSGVHDYFCRPPISPNSRKWVMGVQLRDIHATPGDAIEALGNAGWNEVGKEGAAEC